MTPQPIILDFWEPNDSIHFETYYLRSLHFFKPNALNTWKRRVPTNPEDPFYKFLENMGSISIKKHEMEVL